MHDFFIEIAKWLDPFFILYFSIIYLNYTVLIILGMFQVLKRSKEFKIEDYTPVLQSNTLPSITFIIPAYNESNRIITIIENVMHLTYRYKKIIVVNDGSTDKSIEQMKEKFQLIPIPKYYVESLPTKPILAIYQSKLNPELIVIDKVNGTKYDAMNAGLNACVDTHFVGMDADTYLDDIGFNALIRPVLESPNTIAVGATVRIMNGATLEFNRISTDRFSQNFITSMQTIEYLRTFIMRQGLDHIGGNFCLSGAFSIFIKNAVMKAGGYGPTITNDLELTLRLHRVFQEMSIPYNIKYVADPVAWTEGPSTVKSLRDQRVRWHRGTLESIWFHKKLFFNPKHKGFGLFSFPFLVFGEALEPVIELIAYLYIIVGIMVGVLNPWLVLLLLCITFGTIIIYTLLSLVVEEITFRKYSSNWGLFKMMAYGFLENFGFRQLTVYWRLLGIKEFFKTFSQINSYSKKINEEIVEIEKKRGGQNKYG